MSKSLKIILLLAVTITGSSVCAQTWGTTISDPAIDAARLQMINKVGVNTIVSARFQAAQNRLAIFDQRITSLLSKTSSTCLIKADAAKSLVAARTLLSSVDMGSLIVAPDKKNSSTGPIIDASAAGSIKDTLEKSLLGMKDSVNKISSCPQYKPSAANLTTPR